MKNSLLEYLRLIRIQTSAATASAPLLGGLIAGQHEIIPLFILLIIGIIYHIYGFVLNEYIDVQVDKKSKDLHDKPLVSGSIPIAHAKFIVIFSSAASCIITIIFFKEVLSILFLLIAIILGGVYDVYGKKIVGSDFVLGAGFFFLCIFGASTYTSNFTIIIYLVGFAYFFHIVFNNAVEGGLKDVDHDFLAGAKTTATRLGVKVKEKRLIVTRAFQGFSVTMTIIFLALVFLILYFQDFNFLSGKYLLQIIIVLVLTLILFISLFKFLSSGEFNRPRLKRLFSVHEMTSYFMLILALSTTLFKEVTIFLLLFPFTWYLIFNLILYKKLLQPRV